MWYISADVITTYVSCIGNYVYSYEQIACIVMPHWCLMINVNSIDNNSYPEYVNVHVSVYMYGLSRHEGQTKCEANII